MHRVLSVDLDLEMQRGDKLDRFIVLSGIHAPRHLHVDYGLMLHSFSKLESQIDLID